MHSTARAVAAHSGRGGEAAAGAGGRGAVRGALWIRRGGTCESDGRRAHPEPSSSTSCSAFRMEVCHISSFSLMVCCACRSWLTVAPRWPTCFIPSAFSAETIFLSGTSANNSMMSSHSIT